MAVKRRKKKRKSRYHTGTHDSPKGGACKYRSGWEFSYMKFLDADPNVVRYFYEKFSIPYVSCKSKVRIRQYFPDILIEYVDGTRKLIEIKPKRKLEQAIIMKKHAAARDWCSKNGMIFEVVTEVELKALGLL